MSPTPVGAVIILRDEPGRPRHIHTCIVGEGEDARGHQWACDSPYCLNITRTCEEHGGKRPRRDDE